MVAGAGSGVASTVVTVQLQCCRCSYGSSGAVVAGAGAIGGRFRGSIFSSGNTDAMVADAVVAVQVQWWQFRCSGGRCIGDSSGALVAVQVHRWQFRCSSGKCSRGRCSYGRCSGNTPSCGRRGHCSAVVYHS